MKVKQVVGEHKKGFRAKKYASKPKPYIEPVKPQGPVAPSEQKKQQVKEGAIDRLYGHWMNSEDAPMDDDSGDYNSVYKKAVSFLDGRVNPKYVDNFANALTSYFHGEDDLEPMNVGDELDETTPIGTVSNVSPDGKQVTIKKTDGTELKTTGDAVLPGPDGKTASLAPGAGDSLKPGTPVTSSQSGSMSEEGAAEDVSIDAQKLKADMMAEVDPKYAAEIDKIVVAKPDGTLDVRATMSNMYGSLLYSLDELLEWFLEFITELKAEMQKPEFQQRPPEEQKAITDLIAYEPSLQKQRKDLVGQATELDKLGNNYAAQQTGVATPEGRTPRKDPLIAELNDMLRIAGLK